MKEIVGARIGSTITNSRQAIFEAVEAGTVSQWLDRQHMRFMAAFDLGERWEQMASGPTLFCVDDNGKAYAPSTTDSQP